MKNKKTILPIFVLAIAVGAFIGSNVDVLAAVDGPDTSFATNGFGHYDVPSPGEYQVGYDVQIDESGRYVMLGEFNDGIGSRLVIWRFLSNGAVDTSFNSVGYVTFGEVSDYHTAQGLIIDSEGKYVVVGEYDSTYMGVWRFDTDGSLDTSFNTVGYFSDEGTAAPLDGYSEGSGIHLLAGDKYIITGRVVDADDTAQMAVWMINNDGSLDGSFNGGYNIYDYIDGAYFDAGVGIDVDEEGYFIVTGATATVIGDVEMALWRIDSTTALLDSDFGNLGQSVFTGPTSGGYDTGNKVLVDSDNKYVVVGSLSEDVYSDLAVWRYDSSGDIDTSFGTDGYYHGFNYAGGDADAVANNLILDNGGKYVIVGQCAAPNDQPTIVILRLNNDGKLDHSFNGQGYAVHARETVPGGEVLGERAYSVKLTSNGRYIVTGSSYYPSESEAGYYDAVLWKYSNRYQIDNLDEELDAKVDSVNIETGTSNGVYGETTVNIVKGSAPVADIVTSMVQDRDWDTVEADTSETEYKTYVHNLVGAPGAGASFTMYVLKRAGDDMVGICPGATFMDEVSSVCANIEFRSVTDPTVSTVVIDGNTYWKVTGLSGTGIFSHNQLAQTGAAIWPIAMTGIGVLVVGIKRKGNTKVNSGKL
jgi:uncharacterized delta-60 repeat protein